MIDFGLAAWRKDELIFMHLSYSNNFFYCAGLCICSIDVHVSLHVLLIVQSRKANVLLIDTKTDECC